MSVDYCAISIRFLSVGWPNSKQVHNKNFRSQGHTVAKYLSVMDKRRLVVTASRILEFVLATVGVTALSGSLRDAPSDRTRC